MGKITESKFQFSLTIAFLTIVTLMTGSASAYTVEKSDEPVTGELLVAPSKDELILQPGQSAVREISLVNRTGDTVSVSIHIEDFEGSPNPQESHVFMGDRDSIQGARSWVRPELERIELGRGETVTFSVSVTAPADAQPGGHYAGVMAELAPITDPASGTSLVARVASLFLITVPGELDSRMTLDQPEVHYKAGSGLSAIVLKFNNLGNVHQKVTGTVKISDIRGNEVAEVPVEDWVVLPRSSRAQEIEWPGKRSPGVFLVEPRISHGEDAEILSSAGIACDLSWDVFFKSGGKA